MSKKLGIYYEDKLLGVIGDVANTKAKKLINGHLVERQVYVGDVISFSKYEATYVKVALPNGIWGFGANTYDFKNIEIILSYDDLTIDILRKLQNPDSKKSRRLFDIREIDKTEREEMTIEEIEKALGKKIKIVSKE